MDLIFPDQNPAIDQIHGQGAGAENGRFAHRLQAVPQGRFQTRQQFRHIERFGDIIVGAQFQRLDLAFDVAPRRQHDDGRQRAGTNGLNHGKSILIGQAKIQNDRVGALSRKSPDGRAARSGLDTGITMGWQAGAQEPQNLRLVVHDQNLWQISGHRRILVRRQRPVHAQRPIHLQRQA
jgi:hypothetical protein